MQRDWSSPEGLRPTRTSWTPNQVAGNRQVAIWSPGPSAQALARPSLRYNKAQKIVQKALDKAQAN